MSDISISISLSTVGPQVANSDTPLILSPNASFTGVRSYDSIQSFAADFADTTSPEYRAANAIFDQNPAPDTVKVGRGTNKPTQVYVISIASLLGSTAYGVNADGQGVTATSTSITSAGSPANDTVIGQIVTALNAVPGANYTAVATGGSGSHVCTVTGNAAGNWFSLEVVNPTLLSIKQTHTDPGITADLNAVLLTDADWYGLVTLYNSSAYVAAAAAWAQSNGKLYLPDVNETDAITTATGNGDTIDALKTSAYNRSAGCYHPRPASMFAASYFGRMFPIAPGKDSWKWQTLAGLPVTSLTPDQITKLKGRNGNGYRLYLGLPITFEGTCGDGTFIDVIRGRDWLASTIQVAIYGAVKAAADRGEKIAFNDAGIAVIGAELTSALKQGFDAGVINDDFVVKLPKKANISGANVSARNLAGITFSATLQGSVNAVPITGTISA